jgi:2-polyprenyl-3-methyl-5-hydroxy-6-metoxy-1,4-benzoquinol methylase
MPTDNTHFCCHFCGSRDGLEFAAVERMLGLRDSFLYRECRSCSSIQISKTPENLADYYPKEYYSFQALSLSGPAKIILKKIRMLIFKNLKIFSPRYGYWLKKVNPKFDARIADIGCGSGQLLYELFCGGFENLEGYDPFISDDKQLETGLRLFKKGFGDAQGMFDLIMMHHSFEHMANPAGVLGDCFEKLNPGGKLLVRCPVADAQVWKDKGNLWAQLDAPRHLVIPSVQGMIKLAEVCGLILEEVEFDSDGFQFWATELFERGERLDREKVGKYFSKKDLMYLEKKALRYNLEGKGDQACFYLSKPVIA